MANQLPTILSTALDISPSGDRFSPPLSTDIAFGSVSCGGYVACLMTKYAVVYASKHETMRSQTDIRNSLVQFYRPIIATKPIEMRLREVSLGKAWSTVRVETFQFGKIAASADIWYDYPEVIQALAIQQLENSHYPSSRPLEARIFDQDLEWTSYETAFHKTGFRRAHSYARNLIPKSWPSEIKYTEQWILPGWDCLPQGSCTHTSAEKAHWTTEMIQFAIDMSFPVQENFFPHIPGKKLPMGSISATLEFAEKQKQARVQGRTNWRVLEDDGSLEPITQTVNVTLSMSTEIKRNLPVDGVRWLYLRTEVKRIVDGRMDMEILLCDEGLELIAVSQHVAQIIPSANKHEKRGDKAKM
ncbi:thioesterase-like superfamily-domain-containing protein [Penicillium malachiteum]|uniref:Thioesterase-like superfamily-domain-containing protein n=1 Tax=Penicillium malachiteum TaxID=1324776 RepID=A0AAD6HXC5_9EURO|nr:thioesterase-like superfamily-domain-containing protein [Penicillium malachiteum]